MATTTYRKYSDIPIACRALFTLNEVVELGLSPRPRATCAELDAKDARASVQAEVVVEEKVCPQCGRVYKRTYEPRAAWIAKKTCSASCGARHRYTTKRDGKKNKPKATKKPPYV